MCKESAKIGFFFFLWLKVHPWNMPLTVNSKIYKSKKTYFLEMNPDQANPTQNDIDRYVYHNVKEYQDYKRSFYRERYRAKKDYAVRHYIKNQKPQAQPQAQHASENIQK